MVLGFEGHDTEDRAVVKLIDLENIIISQCTNPGYLESESRYLRMGLVGQMAVVY